MELIRKQDLDSDTIDKAKIVLMWTSSGDLINVKDFRKRDYVTVFDTVAEANKWVKKKFPDVEKPLVCIISIFSYLRYLELKYLACQYR